MNPLLRLGLIPVCGIVNNFGKTLINHIFITDAHPTPCYTDIYGYNAHPYYDTNPYGPLDASSSSNNEHACHYSPKPVGAVTLTIPSAPEMISSPSTSAGTRKSSPSRVELAKPEQKTIPVQTQQLHLIPQNVMTGAVNVASSAINTAKSVLQMITPTRTEEVCIMIYV